MLIAIAMTNHYSSKLHPARVGGGSIAQWLAYLLLDAEVSKSMAQLRGKCSVA